MALILYLIGICGAVAAWIYAGIIFFRSSSEKSVLAYFVHLGGCLAIIFASWLIMVYPSECNGMFCEIAVFLVWAAFSSILFLVWPLVLVFAKKNSGKKNSSNENLIDN